ncbi:MAG: ferrous iron transport protein B [Anaerolineaceae bacterium]|nr:ferrous iron transport protein B [Anaerolineaceae bacterium]
MSDCHSSSTAEVIRTQDAKGHKIPVIALAGQPNMGKSTLFNLLTGLNQHVGNWPGKTVEQRSGNFSFNEREYHLVDLPGTYSLTANSPEEVITREFILTEKPDIVIAVVSAANLERSLYLVSELVCLPVPIVVALNMMDVARQEGIAVDAQELSQALNLPVIAITATKALGVRDLLQKAQEVIERPTIVHPNVPEIRKDVAEAIDLVEQKIAQYVPADHPADWAALKLLEGDVEITKKMKASLPPEIEKSVSEILRENDDAMVAVASSRYNWIGDIVRRCVKKPKMGQISITERIDRIATHPVWGLFILAGILGLVFWLTFTIGSPAQAWLDEAVVGRLASWASQGMTNSPAWLRSLIVDGAIGGVGSVLTFLPILIIFFASFGFLEDIGYMARAAYVMDNIMHMMGLHGKSFLPLFLGFGCNVPAIIGTRVIDSWPARILTILIAPLVPCTARMAVIAFLAPAFFGKNAFLVSWGLILFSIVLLVVLGVLLNKIIFKGERSAFIMEMPLYHIPNLRTVGLLVWQRSWSFIKKAGTTILIASMVIWGLSYLPAGNIDTSYLAIFGKWIEPFGKLMGFDWRLTVALLSSFPAKENAIATLGVLFGNTQGSGLATLLASTFSNATALSFLVVTMLFIPCLATVAVIRQETNSVKWTAFSVLMFLVLSTAMGMIVYHVALLV